MPEERVKGLRASMYLTEAENEALMRHVEASGLSMSNFLRFKLSEFIQ